jgi:hypothetical protein
MFRNVMDVAGWCGSRKGEGPWRSGVMVLRPLNIGDANVTEPSERPLGYVLAFSGSCRMSFSCVKDEGADLPLA